MKGKISRRRLPGDCYGEKLRSASPYRISRRLKRYWEFMERALYLLDASDSEGVDVSFDIYPYRSTATVLYTILPPWITDSGKKMMFERLRNPAIRTEAVRRSQSAFSSAVLVAQQNDYAHKCARIAHAQGQTPKHVISMCFSHRMIARSVSLDLSERKISRRTPTSVFH